MSRYQNEFTNVFFYETLEYRYDTFRRRNVISILLTRSHLRFTENEEIIQVCFFSQQQPSLTTTSMLVVVDREKILKNGRKDRERLRG